MAETNLPNSIVTGTILESVVDRVKTEIDKCAKSSDLATVATSSYVDTNKVDKKDLEYVELEESYSYLGVESPNSTEEIDGVTYTLIKRPSYIGGYSIKGRNFNSEDGTTQSEITISISDTNYLNYSDKLQVMINADIDFENIIMSSITLNALPKELLGKTIIALDNDTYTSEYLNKQYTLTFELTDTNTYTSLTSATLYGKGKIELSELPDDLIIVGGGIGFFPVLDDHPDLYIRINDLGELIINLDNRYASKSSLSDVATSGSYNDLSDVPTTVSSLTNDSGYLTDTTGITESEVSEIDSSIFDSAFETVKVTFSNINSVAYNRTAVNGTISYGPDAGTYEFSYNLFYDPTTGLYKFSDGTASIFNDMVVSKIEFGGSGIKVDGSYLFANLNDNLEVNFDALDFSETTSMRNMFEEAYFQTIDLSGIDYSSVTNCQEMFRNVNAETINLSGWDFTNIDTTDMFKGAYDTLTTVILTGCSDETKALIQQLIQDGTDGTIESMTLENEILTITYE